MRILLVRLSALGDLVHTLPLVGALRRGFPDARIDWLVDERFLDLVALVPALDRSIAWPRVNPHGVVGFERVVSDLRDQRYDVALDAQGLLKSALVARISGARRVIGFSLSQLREPAARWFHTEHADVDSGTHIVEKNLTLARHLDVEVGEWEFPLEVPPSAVVAETRRRLAPGNGNSFVVLNPGTAWQSKCWDPSRYGEVANRLHADYGMRSVVSWGPGEELLAQTVVSESNGAAVTAPPTTLPDLVALLDAAAGVVAGDTGPLHLAAAVGTPVVGVYGPSDPARNGPWDAADEVVSSFADCWCQRDIARSATGGVVVRACHEAERCLDDVSVDDVVDAVTRRLGLPIAHA